MLKASLSLVAACAVASAVAAPAGAVTPAEADAAFAALNKVYWDAKAKFFRKEETGTQKADFWLEAQLWDTVMDQYDRTRSAAVKKQINDVYDGFMAKHPDWTRNKYLDDIMWWCIGCTRAYKITGDKRYLKQAKASFDFVYDKFCDDDLGGGVWWTTDKGSKNSCVNSPTVIAAVRLSDLLNDAAYLDKAKRLYQWQKSTLTDGKGKVYDSVKSGGANSDPKVAKFSLTYNQGTYIGASVLLYLKTKDAAYLAQAKLAADWTKGNLCRGRDRILQSENQGDGGAFKGIFVRYMKLLVRDAGAKEYLPWMQTNADTAWRNRRASDNIMGYDWSATTGDRIQSQSAASAVALVLCFSEGPRR